MLQQTAERIYRTTLWTFEDLSLGGYVVDCPHRERMGYGGDAHATTECGLNNYSLGAFYTKWTQDWRDVQGEDAAWGIGGQGGQPGAGTRRRSGNLPYTAPTYWGGGGPGWSGFCVTLPWEIYRHYGDTRILEENFPTIQRWLAFLETKSKDNMLRRWGGQWDFLGDWLWPGAKGVNGDTRETLFFNNCYWIYNLQTAAKIADVLGKDDAAAAYRQRAEAVRQAVHARFFRPEDNSYVNGFPAYLAIALLVGPAARGSAARRLEAARGRDPGPPQGPHPRRHHGRRFLIKTLLDADRHDLIFEMATKEDYPSWGDMLRRGATTFWESWDGDISLLHSSYLYIGTVVHRGPGRHQARPRARASNRSSSAPACSPGEWTGSRPATSRPTGRSPALGRSKAANSTSPSRCRRTRRLGFCSLRRTSTRSASPAVRRPGRSG